MADIFLSYARADQERAKQIAKALEARGWSVWWDVSLAGGDRFRSKLDEQLRLARCVVVLWSRQSIESDWVIDEAEDGKKRKTLVQALIEEVQPPHGFRQIQAARLIDGTGGYSGEFARFCAGISAHAPLSAVDHWRNLDRRFSSFGNSTLIASMPVGLIEQEGVTWSISGTDSEKSKSEFLMLADEAGDLLLKCSTSWRDVPTIKFPDSTYRFPHLLHNYWLFFLEWRLNSLGPIKNPAQVSAEACAYCAEKEKEANH